MPTKKSSKSENKSSPSQSNYEALGVSSKKEDVHGALKTVDQGLYPNAFCKIIEDITMDPAYCSILHADGAGTKSAVAYMMYKETGDLKYFRGIVHDAVVMNTDDLLCVGATERYFLSNTIGRNKKLISGEIVSTIIDEYEKFTQKLNGLGLPIKTCGGETADVGDLVRTLMVDSTIMARMKRSDVITPERIQPNDVIVGLASYGKASYEEDIPYNSGIGSNGLTLARHGVLNHTYFKKYPECVAPEVNPNLAFFGKYELNDPLPGTPITVGEAILSPTRTYAPIIVKILEQHRPDIHAIYHNSGGGQTKCIKFGSSLHYIKDNLFPVPPFFELIQQSSNTQWEEMYQVFNMGHRMELICSEAIAKEVVIPIAQKFNVDAKIVGHIEKSSIKNQNIVSIQSAKGNFKY